MPEESQTLDANISEASSASEGAAPQGAGGESPAPAVEQRDAKPHEEKSLADIASEVAERHKTPKETDSSTEKKEAPKVPEVEPEEGDEEEPAPKGKPLEEEEETEDDEVAKLPFNKHPRFQQIVKERNESKAELERVKPFAESAQALATYCQQNGILQEDLEGALELVALSKRDMKSFRGRLQEIADGIDYSSGAKLPPDLREKVEAGELSPEVAKELVQLREKNKQSSASAKAAQAAAQKQAVTNMSTALDQWEASQKKTDPEYAKRHDALRDRMVAMWTQTPPRSVAEAISLAEKANAEIKQRYSIFQPKRAAFKLPALKTNGSSTTTSKGAVLKMDNLKDDLTAIVNHVMAKHRGGA